MVGTVVTNLCPQDICLHIIKMSLFHLSSQVTFIAFYFVEKKTKPKPTDFDLF